MQAADGDDRTPGRTRRERRMLTVALAQASQKVSDVLRTDSADVLQSALIQRRCIPVQVAPVGLQRVRGQAPLYRQIVEVGRDRLRGSCQLSTSASVAADMSCASATGSHVTWPSCVFRPSANDGSRRSASRQPRLAISTAYGSVTLVSA